jgi:Zn-dependent peptidase ImmA (M78 family)/DNA-binding XRE family transcriptional regulator
MLNRDMLLLARARERVTQARLAALTGIPQGTISKIEHGLRAPTVGELASIATALSVPTSFLTLSTEHRFLDVPTLFRVKSSTVSKAAIDQLNAEMLVRARHLKSLLQSAEISPKLPLPTSVDDEAPETAAQRVRNLWLVRPGPIRNLTALCEAAGLFVIELDTDVPGFDGAMFRGPDLPTIIFVRHGQPADRRRATIAHELGHYLLHNIVVPSKAVEREAYRFAQELLTPAAEIRRRFGPSPDLAWLRQLKREWHVSISFLIMRAASVGAITDRKKTSMFQSLSMLGWRTTEPEELPAEVPTLFANTLRFVCESLQYSADELARVFHELPARVSSVYGIGTDTAKNPHGLKLI